MLFTESRLVRYLTIGLAALPLTLLWYYEKSIYPFITVKVAAFEVAVLLVAVFWLLLIIRHGQYRPRLTRLHTVILGFLIVITITAAFGVNPLRSFWSVQERGIGVIGLWHLYIWYLMLASLMRQSNELRARIVRWHFWISTVVAGFAVLQRIAPALFFVGAGDRPGGTLGNPSYLAAYLSITIFLGLWLATQAASRRGQWVLYIAATFEIGIVVLSETRGALLGLGVAAVVALCWLALKQWHMQSGARRYVQNIPLILLALMFIAGGVVYGTKGAVVWQSIPGLNRIVTLSLGEGTSLNRFIAWGASLDAAKEHPLLGYGFENFRYPFDARYDARLLRSGLADTYFDKPHNTPLEMLVSGGIPAFLLYLGLIVLLGLRLARLPSGWILVVGVVAYFVQNMFVFDTVGSYVAFFALLGVAESSYGSHAAKAGRSISPVLTNIVIAGAGIIWLASAAYQCAIVYSNLQQYRMLNAFANRLYDNALVHRAEAVRFSTPYIGSVHENFLTITSSAVQNNLLRDVRKFIEPALVGYAEAIRRDPNNYFLYINRADVATILGRLDHAYAVDIGNDIARADFLSPHRQQTYYVSAKYKLLKGDLPGAYQEMKKAVDLDPLAGDPHYYYGVLAYEQGDSKTGLAEFKTALRLGWYPLTASAAKTVAGRLGDDGQYEDAYKIFNSAYKLEPTDVDTRFKLALVAYYTQRFTEAKELFQSVIHEKEFADPNSRLSQELQPIFDQLGVIR